MKFNFRFPKGKRKEKLGDLTKREVRRSLTTSQRALGKIGISTLLVSLMAALIPVAQKAFLEKPSVLTITLYAGTAMCQTLFLVLFFQQANTLSAYMSRYMYAHQATSVESTSVGHLKSIKHRLGQLHSGLINKLVENYSFFLPTAVKDALIVLGQQVGIALAFGWKYLLVSLLGLALLYGLVPVSTRITERFSQKLKRLDAKVNNHMDSYTESLDVWQAAGTTSLKQQHLYRVLTQRIKLYQRFEIPLVVRTGITRTLPTFITTWVVLYIAVADGQSTPELAMLVGFVNTSMQVSYTGIQLFMQLADSQGDLEHLDELSKSPPRPEGPHEIRGIEVLSLSANTSIRLSDTRTLFPQGLFHNDPAMTALRITAGEFVVIAGPSGCGKTQLVKILTRQSENMSGSSVMWDGKYEVTTGGKPVNVFSTTLASFNAHVGYCSQQAKSVNGVREVEGEDWRPGTVRENIGLPLHHEELAHLSAADREELIQRAASIVLLSDMLDQQVEEQSSGGEASRCMLGRSLVQAMINPEWSVLFIDELSQLDPDTGQQIVKNLFHVKEEFKLTIVMTTHSHLLAPYSATGYVLGANGEGIVDFGTVRELVNRPDSKYNQLLNPAPLRDL